MKENNDKHVLKCKVINKVLNEVLKKVSDFQTSYDFFSSSFSKCSPLQRPSFEKRVNEKSIL